MASVPQTPDLAHHYSAPSYLVWRSLNVGCESVQCRIGAIFSISEVSIRRVGIND